jgi:hyaluronan synthase
VSQINVPIPVRFVRYALTRLLDVTAVQWFDVAAKSGLVALFGGILALAIHTGSLTDNFPQLYATPLGATVMMSIAAYSSLMLLVLLVRVLMVMGYKSAPSLPDGDLPSVTVIIPAYNEGADVARSIDSIARSHYPHAKLQIIAIDDGSKDDTWLHMQAAAHRHPDVVCAVRMDKNGGKRQGLRVGFALAAGDVLVTMDSDSVVERNSLRSLVTPLAKDPRIGAVAGNVKVQNRDAGILPRMMRASFVLAFDFTRAYQSKIGAVLCTPGAFSAYRRSAVEAVLNDWNNQTFCGKPSTIAEDRALTNLVLREGHEIVFQSDAVVWTNVPTTYMQMARMYQRWERGNVRENIAYARFCWKPFRKRYRMAANAEWLLSVLDMMIPYLLIAASLVYGIINPFFMLKFLSFIILFSGLMQSYYYMKERNSDFIYGIAYSLFWFTCLWWVVPWSIVTAGNGQWMTRTLPGGDGAMPGRPTRERLAA